MMTSVSSYCCIHFSSQKAILWINNFPVTPKKTELTKFQTMVLSKSDVKPLSDQRKHDKPMPFKDLVSLPNKTDIKSITAKVITLSKDISGAFGKYCIGKLKDITCDKMDINIYHMRLKHKMAVGESEDNRIQQR